MMGRRYKVVPLEARVVADMLRPSRREHVLRVVEGVPEDATLDRVWFDYNRDCFMLAFSHPDWPEVLLGAWPETLAVVLRSERP